MSKTKSSRTATHRKSDTVATKPEATAPGASEVDTAHDHTAPDAPVSHLVRHARALASLVLTHAARLTFAKVSAADADALTAAASELVAAEEAWLHRCDAPGVGHVGKARTPVRVGRDDLFEALRTYAEHDDDTQRTLDDIAGVDDDDDLAQDTVRLIALTRRHLGDLEGTEITVSYLTDLQSSLTAFEAARGVVRTRGMQVDSALVATRARRNRAFWALATLDRTMVKRCRFGLRREPELAAQFTSYHNALRRRRQTAAAPATPAATPTVTD